MGGLIARILGIFSILALRKTGHRWAPDAQSIIHRLARACLAPEVGASAKSSLLRGDAPRPFAANFRLSSTEYSRDSGEIPPSAITRTWGMDVAWPK